MVEVQLLRISLDRWLLMTRVVCVSYIMNVSVESLYVELKSIISLAWLLLWDKLFHEVLALI